MDDESGERQRRRAAMACANIEVSMQFAASPAKGQTSKPPV
jgi:hypothetical protein